ncbi:MAG: heme o synthase [Brevibacterium aurantiacum]|uniref:Protoheme IX farnesyltransferase n=1 Tax=Brevibacterium aurantiacum TaxID=273384 RepID=A0A1D7W4C0_BREAU|nr:MULTISPECIES: heme o synthase [Brevibacterium]MDN5550288.1 heme o synthase [Brevibacterium sp.]AOP53851.1 Heme O synthase, protoheme IX farnesyltransferase COX10-CtaB [Brevibacterium aurantiacum]AZL05962.1 protoheme IX farnesyltransferase [Brevibacterium aurantiacum]AZL09524.1 protoheme IX farnesyltransferase [Brevibacterium aurantiacum]AZL13159.1 protoheme IX farnesyltransferase [Brevibacterium aurantiacum]
MSELRQNQDTQSERPLQRAIDEERLSKRPRSIISAYIALTKPRVIELLLVTTAPVMFLAAQGMPNIWLVINTLIGGAAAAASASVFNCYVDRDIDAKMERTKHRPLVTGEITPRAALIFAFALGLGSIFWLGGTTNWVTAGLTACAILLYAVFYTLILKRRTTQNIVWGGAAGCMPVLIGWSAVTGGLAWEALLLFLVVFFWTPPHYWPLAIKYKADYDAADVPMLPSKVPPTNVGRQMIAYTWAMVLCSLALIPLAPMGPVYTAVAVLAGAWFLFSCYALVSRAKKGKSGTSLKAMKVFHGSITYLSLLFLAVAIDPFVLPGFW